VDIWSIGIITYMLLTGRTPYGGKNKQELKNNIATKDVDWTKPYVESLSSEAKKFMKKCLTRDIGSRPSAEQMLNDPWIKKQTKNRDQVNINLKQEA